MGLLRAALAPRRGEVTLSTVISGLNHSDLAEMARLARERGVDRCALHWISRVPRELLDGDGASDQYAAVDRHLLLGPEQAAELKARARAAWRQYGYATLGLLAVLPLETYTQGRFPLRTCRFTGISLNLAQDGTSVSLQPLARAGLGQSGGNPLAGTVAGRGPAEFPAEPGPRPARALPVLLPPHAQSLLGATDQLPAGPATGHGAMREKEMLSPDMRFRAAVVLAACCLALLAGPARAGSPDPERQQALEHGNRLLAWVLEGGPCHDLLAMLPDHMVNSQDKRQAMRDYAEGKRREILAWLGPIAYWELDLVKKRDNGKWKVRYRFIAPGVPQKPKPRYKTLHFVLTPGPAWRLQYLGGWELERGSVDFLP